MPLRRRDIQSAGLADPASTMAALYWCRQVVSVASALAGRVRAVVFSNFRARAIFDRSRTMEVEGTVSSVFWRNPHIGLTLLVENEAGEPEDWEIEGGTYNDLLRSGFDPETVAIGDPVRIVGAPSRRGPPGIHSPTTRAIAARRPACRMRS